MAFSTTPVAGSLEQGRSIPWSMLIEAALVFAAIGALLPWFARLAQQEFGRDARFAATIAAVRGLPEPVLPTLCASLGGSAGAPVRDRLCAQTGAVQAIGRVDRLPRVLVDAKAGVRQAFVAPLQEARARVAGVRLRQREGLGELSELGSAIAAGDEEIQTYLARYRLEGAGSEGPLPLACAFDQVEAMLAGTAATGIDREQSRAGAVLLLGAALDAHPATPTLAKEVLLARPRTAPRYPCFGLDATDALAATAALMADARAGPAGIAKNEAMRALLRTAGWQWASWALVGLLLLHLSRRPSLAAIGVALALATWAAAAWIGRVPWPFASGQALVLARQSASAFAAPADFVLWLLGAGVVVLISAPWLAKVLATGPQQIASALGYPGLVFATGVGWLLLLDLSANAHVGNRYLALYHHGHLWVGMLTFSLLAFVRQPLGRALSRMLSFGDSIASGVGRRVGTAGSAALLLVLMLALVGAVGALLLNVRQLTSEIGRLWLIVGAAWFFFLRGTPLTERLARSGASIGSLVRYVWPLLFVVVVLIGAMIVTRDMGPLLVACYGAGAFVAASVATWWYQRQGTTGAAGLLAVALFVAWILATTAALFRLGSLDEIAAARLENLAAPLASANDQLALVTWFQRASPPTGFGVGSVPWCGFGGAGACAGVPAQIQSDYTFTALVGAFGWTAAWAMALGVAVWLHLLVGRHGAVTRGEPRFLKVAGRMSNDDQAFVSWLCVTWVVLALCQLAVTIAGNLAVIPLTGVTFPFVSFGMTSLVVNMAMLGLAINVNGPHEGVND